MRDNVARDHLAMALRALPGDAAHRDVRALVGAAIAGIDLVEERRARRNRSGTAPVPPNWAPPYALTARECRQAVLGIDRLIQKEQAKLALPEKNEPTPPHQDVQTILG